MDTVVDVGLIHDEMKWMDSVPACLLTSWYKALIRSGWDKRHHRYL